MVEYSAVPFSRPYGTWPNHSSTLPSDKSLGYFRKSLRDKSSSTLDMKKPPQISLKMLCGFIAGFAILLGIGRCAWEDVRMHHVTVQDMSELEGTIDSQIWAIVASFPSEGEIQCRYRQYPAFVQLSGIVEEDAVEYSSNDGVPFAQLHWPGNNTVGFGEATGGGLMYRFKNVPHPGLYSELQMTDERKFQLIVLRPRD